MLDCVSETNLTPALAIAVEDCETLTNKLLQRFARACSVLLILQFRLVCTNYFVQYLWKVVGKHKIVRKQHTVFINAGAQTQPVT